MAAVPVEAYRPRDGTGILIVGIDDSPASVNALAYAIGLGRREGSSLVVVRVETANPYSPIGTDPGVIRPPGPLASVGRLPEGTAQTLDESLPGRWCATTRAGDPGTELERAAAELGADAIVVGRARNPLRHPLGSVPGRLARAAKRPIIVVP